MRRSNTSLSLLYLADVLKQRNCLLTRLLLCCCRILLSHVYVLVAVARLSWKAWRMYTLTFHASLTLHASCIFTKSDHLIRTLLRMSCSIVHSFINRLLIDQSCSGFDYPTRRNRSGKSLRPAGSGPPKSPQTHCSRAAPPSNDRQRGQPSHNGRARVKFASSNNSVFTPNAVHHSERKATTHSDS